MDYRVSRRQVRRVARGVLVNWKENARSLIDDLVERMNELDSLVLDLQYAIDIDDEAKYIVIKGKVDKD